MMARPHDHCGLAVGHHGAEAYHNRYRMSTGDAQRGEGLLAAMGSSRQVYQTECGRCSLGTGRYSRFGFRQFQLRAELGLVQVGVEAVLGQ
jgi:hypothetical protein